MRIGIEAQRIFRKNKHGMDYVVLEEIRQLQKMDTGDEFFVFVSPGDDPCVSSTEHVHVIEVKCPTYPLWEQVALPRAAKKAKVDILHCTSNTAPIRGDIPLVLTLHDIIFLEPRDNNNKSLYQNMGWYYRRLVVPRILDKCKRIITVSNFEYDNIQRKLNIGDRLRMIHNGYNEWFKPLQDDGKVYSKYIPEPGYFFFLGNTDPKKNTARTLTAYHRYLQRSKVKRKLLLADLKQEFFDKVVEENNIGEIRDYVVSPGYIVNSDLPYIYNGAFAFLYTSLRESFGIPLIEAMACGTPVITGQTSSLPEIAGDAAVMVNVENIDEIADAMLRLEEDENLQQEKRAAGIERAKLFSWKKTTEELVKVYHELS